MDWKIPLKHEILILLYSHLYEISMKPTVSCPFLFLMFLGLFPLTVLVSLAKDLSFGAFFENV